MIFSGEKKFYLDDSHGFSGYWRDLRKEPRYISKRNIGGGSLIVWGDFCSDAMLDLAFSSTRTNSGEYIDILNEKLKPFLEAQAEKTFIFQQDHASVHKIGHYNPSVRIIRFDDVLNN